METLRSRFNGWMDGIMVHFRQTGELDPTIVEQMQPFWDAYPDVMARMVAEYELPDGFGKTVTPIAKLAAGVPVEQLSDDELLLIVRAGGGPDVDVSQLNDEELERIIGG